MFGRRRVEGIELGKDEARVVVDIPADGHHWDAAVVDAKSVEVGAGEDGGLELVDIG